MKKQNLLKLALVSIAMMVFTGAWAQNPPVPYEEYDANTTVPTNVDYVTLLSGGTTTLGYYALPDALYHPNYVAAGTLTAGFVWNWSASTDPGTATAFNVTDNYVEITYDTPGDYVIEVYEEAPAGLGGCSDASPTIMNVTVIDPPTGNLSILPGGWQEITANAAYQICNAQVAQTVTLTFVENSIPTTLAGYEFAVAYKVEEIDGTDAVTATPTPWTILEDYVKGGTGLLASGNVGGLTAAAFNVAGAPNYVLTFNTAALDISNNSRTKYSYKVVRTGTAGADITAGTDNADFRSAISIKSQYIDGAEYYAFTNEEVYFIVNPAPSTGPIYHIPNDFAF